MNPWPWVLALLFAVGGAWGGHKITKAHYVAKEVARIEAEQKEVARLNQLSYDLGQALAAETRKRQDDARAHRAEIQNWRKHATVQIECPAADGGFSLKSVSPDSVRFDAGFVDLWNGGLRLGLPRPQLPADLMQPPSAPILLPRPNSSPTSPTTPKPATGIVPV